MLTPDEQFAVQMHAMLLHLARWIEIDPRNARAVADELAAFAQLQEMDEAA